METVIYEGHHGYRIATRKTTALVTSAGKKLVVPLEREKPLPERQANVLRKHGLDPDEYFFAGGTVMRAGARKAWREAVEAHAEAERQAVEDEISQHGLRAFVLDAGPGGTTAGLAWVRRPDAATLERYADHARDGMVELIRYEVKMPRNVAWQWVEEQAFGRATHHLYGESSIWLVTAKQWKALSARAYLEEKFAAQQAKELQKIAEDALADARSEARRTGLPVELSSEMVLDESVLDESDENTWTLVRKMVRPDGRVYHEETKTH